MGTSPVHRIGRIALLGLAMTLLGLTALSVVGAASTRRYGELVAQSSALDTAYSRANAAVITEESLERKYRLEPGPAVRDWHAAAAADLRAALEDVRADGDAADRALVDSVLTRHEEYQQAIVRMFDAVDAGDQVRVAQIDAQDTDPAFEGIAQDVEAAAQQHRAAAQRAMAQLRHVESGVFVAMVAGFGVGLVLLSAFGLVVVGYHRALIRQARVNEHQALHDALTGLPNRSLLRDRLERALSACRRTDTTLAVLVLDLNGFKEVNDSLGHHHGDELLRQVAGRIRAVLLDSDTVARLGGDEFAILLPTVDPVGATEFAGRVLGAVQDTFEVGEFRIDVEASIGVVIAPSHGDTLEDLMRHADVAMYAAKEGRTGVAVYDPGAHDRNPMRLLVLGDLRRALAQPDELRLHYQPKIDLRGGRLCGVEALLRWYHPTQGLISPADFIPLVEETSLINRLTARVLSMAVGQLRGWLDQGTAVPVAVNLSPRCLLDAKLPAYIRDLMEQNGVPAHLLRLEVTEGALMADTALAVKILTELHEMGVRLSIDDYGTGYSSMSYLKQLPVDELKIDRSFVMDMTDDANNAVLVRGAIELGHRLGLSVVAEGVERSDHVQALRGLGCDIAQGYHYAHAMPPEELTAWLHTQEPVAVGR